MNKYEYIKVLCERYHVKASFYQYKNQENPEVLYRNVADIKRNDCKKEMINGYIIMMSPGSCKTNAKVSTIINCKEISINWEVVNPDSEQLSVMRLMDELNWDHVRIFNLIDYREPTSNKMKLYAKRQEQEISIFSKVRRKELESLTQEQAPFIVAWGVDNGLDYYAEKAIDFLQGKTKVGIPHKNGTYAYKYIKPLRKKDQEKVQEALIQEIKKIQQPNPIA